MFTWLGLLEASVVGGICIILFFLVSQLFGERYRANYRKVIWLLIVVRMCIPISMSIFPKPVTVQVPVFVLAQSGSGQRVGDTDGIGAGAPLMTEKSQIDGTPAIGENGSVGTVGAEAVRRQLTSQDILVILWGCGSVGVLAYYLLAHCIFCHRMWNKSRECADERILAITEETAEELRLKKIPPVRLVRDPGTGPFTVGFLHNIVFLPDTDYQEKDLRYIIRHELVHCAGKDTQMKALFVIVNAIHWFNPLAWFMKSLVDQDMELACDERVLADTSRKERSEYGELLMSCIGTDKADRSAISTGYVQGVKFIKKRFRNIFHTHKKSGKVVGSIIVLLLVAVSAMIGFEAGRNVYARSKIAIDSGIELRTDVTGDGEADRVWVRDDTYTLTTSVGLQTADGRDLQYDYDDETWAASWLVSGDLSGNGAADIVVMRYSNGMHGTGPVSVLHVTGESGELRWQEYPKAFIPNPSIDWEQPRSFEDIECVEATIIEDNGRHFLRLIALDLEVFDDNTVQYIDCSLQEDGWFIEDVQTTVLYPQDADGGEAEPEQPPTEKMEGEDKAVLKVMMEGEMNEIPATLFVGEGYSIYLTDGDWQQYAPDAWAGAVDGQLVLNGQVQFWIAHYEDKTADQVKAELAGDGYTSGNSDMIKQESGVIYKVRLNEFENDVWGVFYCYPVGEAEEGWGALLPVIVDTFAVSGYISVNDSYYNSATDISCTEVENYAAFVKQSFMEHDWRTISSEISYPITISGTTYSDRAAFLDASKNFDSNLNEKFFSYLEEEDCVEMFVNSQGIMLGETGQIWIADVLDDKSNSHGLKILAINDLLKVFDSESLRKIVVDFYEGYFGGDIDSIKPYLAEPFDWDIEVHPTDNVEISAIKGLENAEGKDIGETCEVSVEFRESGADNYFYLTIEFIRTEQGWKIYFYGIEG